MRLQLARSLATALLVISLGATPPAAAQSTTEQAIHEVIQRANQAQAQAVARNDPTLLAEGSTEDYTLQLMQATLNLLAIGVVAIELVNLEWGGITVDGPRATATSFETWRTTYGDGPTEFARDRNVYTLTQTAGGTWLVARAEHPDGQNRAQRSPPAPPGPPPPDLEPGTGTSRNWSGYAARGGRFTSVSATWTIPLLALDGPFGADAAWVGIGGVRSRDLIQAGTQQSVSGVGSVSYQAWIETLPEASQPVPLTVLPGDSINVSVDLQSVDTWLIAFVNLTSGQTLQRTVQYSSSLGSAEWIEEAPSARQGVLPLAQFGSLSFSGASAVKDGQSLAIAELSAQAISLVDQRGRPLAVPSPLGPDGASFSVSRT